jgi:hypothetical protein
MYPIQAAEKKVLAVIAALVLALVLAGVAHAAPTLAWGSGIPGAAAVTQVRDATVTATLTATQQTLRTDQGSTIPH